MSLEFVVIGIILLVGFGFVLYRQQKQQTNPEIMEIVRLLQQSSTQDRSTLLSSLQKNTSDVNLRLDRAAQVIGKLQQHIGELSEIGRGMKEMHELLRSPKLRGSLGEHVLKELLIQLLPKQSIHLQYEYKNGTIVDAAIKTSNGIIPIDAKFPLENFRKLSEAKTADEQAQVRRQFIADVKKHIRAISTKYIAPQEETLDYALMYIPSEAIYYEIANDAELFDFASSQRVLPVSPTTLYAYLRAILMSFEGQKIEKRAQQILRTLQSIRHDYEVTGQSLETLNRHISHAYGAANTALHQFSKLGTRIGTAEQLNPPAPSLPSDLT
ncbi:hypothetical protein A3B56_02455 [Candidatus Roizmanbacteria bacterium RIFCSPLOWO2_01_FULL_45_11]|uniref:DNA recombination protein RmuC n=1 Tax=Candidatus Roizmanbacteria bacterium RIFCSPLOWO2_01_FULL_45_11 TaxID=1802070 RepID=A0A1F7JJ11_9BACT|nr:MAG: hypothetical protein A3B56_02455 [Candidatus Roizmanbacteria bacterium RIFCSPLOWO2_01_FULL_45_11]